MKASVFNIFVDTENGEKLLYNSFRNSLVKLDKSTYETYKKITLQGGEDAIDMLDPLVLATIADFKRGGFIIDDDMNEVDYIKVVDVQSRFSHSKNFGLTIAPTLDCNFDCVYCYENHKEPKYMSRETENKVIDYVKEHLEDDGYLSITWYGGEPLLALETIYRLSETFIKITGDKNAGYDSMVITNGYLLSRKVAENLKKYKVTRAQITVDGAPEYHDSVRRLKNGKGTFDRILSNIREAKEIYEEFMISIRMNVGKENVDSFPVFIDKLEEYKIKNKISLGISEVEPHEYLCGQVNDATFTPEEFSRVYVRLVDMAVERGVPLAVISNNNLAHCSSTKKDAFLIGPDGKLYKCWDVIGNHLESVGEIGEDIKILNGSLKWLAWDMFKNKMCHECNVLPLCMGGCPRKSLVKDKIVNSMDHCNHIRYCMPELIKIMYKQRRLMKKIG
ncbi:MAG: radical SAM protein [Firmicutes bacterium]|nr:radical SAM protein [Bacillota bacterium]